jgi:mRNA-degrading endonuclease RelE of RelBE toxin-antitoxin system
MKKKFELVFTKEFLRRLRDLDKKTQIRILRELKILEEQPSAGKRLVGRLNELMSFRVGEYRIIYQLSEKTIIIRTVGHRKKVYEK